MVARLPSIAVLVFAFSGPMADAGHASAITLERNPSTAPFHAGDRLQLDAVSAKKLDIKEFTVLQMASWPWVLVRCDAGAKPYEIWVNFARIGSARRIAVTAK